MRSNTESRNLAIGLIKEDDTPAPVWIATWLTVGLLVLMLLLGALFLSGFFSTIKGSAENPGQTTTRPQQ